MTLKDYLCYELGEEKAFRAAMYIGGQLKEAKTIHGYPTVQDVADSNDEFEYLFVFGTGDKWALASVMDPGCNSPLIDGDYGWFYPDDDDTFYPFRDYGRTWIAIPAKEAMAEEGWPMMDEARKLLSD